MKYKDGRKYCRKIGQARKSQSVYDNLGHPHEIEKKDVIFIGKEEKAYCLTKNKKYTIFRVDSGKFCWDKDLCEQCKDKEEKNYEACQGEDYFITIINDKGHKRKYSHLMFRLMKE